MPEIYCEECRAWSAGYDQILDAGNKTLDRVEEQTKQILALQSRIRKLTTEIMEQDLEIERLRSLPPNARDQGARPNDAGQAPDATIPRSPASTC